MLRYSDDVFLHVLYPVAGFAQKVRKSDLLGREARGGGKNTKIF
jgi:hypothetical protein